MTCRSEVRRALGLAAWLALAGCASTVEGMAGAPDAAAPDAAAPDAVAPDAAAPDADAPEGDDAGECPSAAPTLPAQCPRDGLRCAYPPQCFRCGGGAHNSLLWWYVGPCSF
jgi:hypothetical protein